MKCKQANRQPISDFLIDSISNVCHINLHFLDNQSKYTPCIFCLHGLDDLHNGSSSNINITIGSQRLAIFHGNSNVYPIHYRLQDICSGTMHDLDLDR